MNDSSRMEDLRTVSHVGVWLFGSLGAVLVAIAVGINVGFASAVLALFAVLSLLVAQVGIVEWKIRQIILENRTTPPN